MLSFLELIRSLAKTKTVRIIKKKTEKRARENSQALKNRKIKPAPSMVLHISQIVMYDGNWGTVNSRMPACAA